MSMSKMDKKLKRISVRVGADEYTNLVQQAHRDHRTLSRYVLLALQLYGSDEDQARRVAELVEQQMGALVGATGDSLKASADAQRAALADAAKSVDAAAKALDDSNKERIDTLRDDINAAFKRLAMRLTERDKANEAKR